MSLEKDAVAPREEGGEYEAVLRLAQRHEGITYARFDALTTDGISLFAVREGYDFDRLERLLDEIIASLGAIKRIFARPITRLTDVDEILPVESVNVINSRTVTHAAVHSETWGEIGKEGIRPRKLLTLRHEDSYVTYENIAFAKAITTVMRLVARNLRALSDILYTSREMRFNLLEREHHLAYFLAIGKLHISYVRDYDKYRAVTGRCIEKMLFIDRVIGARLTSPVYRACRDRTARFSLKKTTTFRVHKDYRRIYLLLKSFALARVDEEEAEKTSPRTREGYRAYCAMITVFAAAHFNFTFSPRTKLSFLSPDASASFGDFSLSVQSVASDGLDALLLSVKKEREYRILLLPDYTATLGAVPPSVRETIDADEYLCVLEAAREGALSLSLFDIESFRRIQQLLLRAMVYADTKRTVCPFCGGTLSPGKRAGTHLCEACRTEIKDAHCDETDKAYAATSLFGYRPRLYGERTAGRRERLLREKYKEGLLFFRNITPIDESGLPLCPHCGKRHE